MGVLSRREYEAIFGQMVAAGEPSGLGTEEGEMCFRFSNGATIAVGHLAEDDPSDKYQGNSPRFWDWAGGCLGEPDCPCQYCLDSSPTCPECGWCDEDEDEDDHAI